MAREPPSFGRMKNGCLRGFPAAVSSAVAYHSK